MREAVKEEALISDKAHDKVYYECECEVSYRETSHPKILTSSITSQMKLIWHFDELVKEEPVLIMEGEANTDRNIYLEHGVKSPPRMTNMAWRTNRPDFWVPKP